MNNYNIAKKACYLSGFSMAITANISPLLFVTFKNMYGLSYTMIGFLVVINYVTQLLIDLVFTFFTKHFNIHKTVKSTPLIIFLGLLLYSIMPRLFPETAVLWIVLGTVVFSISSGLCEVLLSPVVAAMPSDNPEADMSKLHSMYAWGTAIVVIVSTIFVKLFGGENWMYLVLLWSVLPFVAYLIFRKAELPELDNFGKEEKKVKLLNKGIVLCTICIFLGGAAECTMAQWASSFIEMAIGVPKVYGDVLGVAMFGLLLGIGRTVYSKYGKNIINVMLFGMIGAFLCYFVAGLSLNPVVGVIACGVTGICTAMLWPGTLIYVEEKFANVGVAVYALMAAGGDMGASAAPQLMGIISDKFSLTDMAVRIAQVFSVSPEQVGMRAGIIVAGLFPFLGILVILCMKKHFNKAEIDRG